MLAGVAPRRAASAEKRWRMRSIAQKRFTAVGRVAASTVHMVSNSAVSSEMLLAGLFLTPRASPMAAETPMAGAPRTTMVVMMSATC